MLVKLVPKLHTVAGLAMFLFVAMMVVEKDINIRALLLLPIVVCYMLSKVLFSMDQANMVKDILDKRK